MGYSIICRNGSYSDVGHTKYATIKFQKGNIKFTHILEDLKKEAGQNNQAEQLQMQQMQLQMQQMQAKIQEITSKAMLNQAQAQAVSGGGATETPKL